MKTLSMHSILTNAAHANFTQGGPQDLAAQLQAVVPGYAQLPAGVIDEDILLVQDRFPLNPTQRLVVLVPPGEIDETILARRVWQLANSSCFNVLYLALSPDGTQTAYQRRRVVSLASMTSGQRFHSHGSVSTERNWQQALEHALQPGDLLVCLASHKIPKHVMWHTLLGKQLAITMGIPVYLFSGFKIAPAPQERQTIQEALAWIFSLLLIAAFFGIQVSIDRSIAGPLSTFLLWLSVVVEVYLLWKINELIG